MCYAARPLSTPSRPNLVELFENGRQRSYLGTYSVSLDHCLRLNEQASTNVCGQPTKEGQCRRASVTRSLICGRKVSIVYRRSYLGLDHGSSLSLRLPTLPAVGYDLNVDPISPQRTFEKVTLGNFST